MTRNTPPAITVPLPEQPAAIEFTPRVEPLRPLGGLVARQIVESEPVPEPPAGPVTPAHLKGILRASLQANGDTDPPHDAAVEPAEGTEAPAEPPRPGTGGGGGQEPPHSGDLGGDVAPEPEEPNGEGNNPEDTPGALGPPTETTREAFDQILETVNQAGEQVVVHDARGRFTSETSPSYLEFDVRDVAISIGSMDPSATISLKVGVPGQEAPAIYDNTFVPVEGIRSILDHKITAMAGELEAAGDSTRSDWLWNAYANLTMPPSPEQQAALKGLINGAPESIPVCTQTRTILYDAFQNGTVIEAETLRVENPHADMLVPGRTSLAEVSVTTADGTAYRYRQVHEAETLLSVRHHGEPLSPPETPPPSPATEGAMAELVRVLREAHASGRAPVEDNDV